MVRLSTIPFSTPGHKLGAGLDRDLRDLLGGQFCAADVWLNTADHDHSLRQAEDLAAQTWGADRSFFLVNGSSSGNQAFLLATVAPGDEVVVGRDLHQSLLAALILTERGPCMSRRDCTRRSISGWDWLLRMWSMCWRRIRPPSCWW